MIYWNCIACQELLEAPESMSGGALPCPKCGVANAVPAHFWAQLNRRWFLVALAGGMLFAGIWAGVRLGRREVVATERSIDHSIPDSVFIPNDVVDPSVAAFMSRCSPDRGWEAWTGDRLNQIEGGFKRYHTSRAIDSPWMKADIWVGDARINQFDFTMRFEMERTSSREDFELRFISTMAVFLVVTEIDGKRLMEQMGEDFWDRSQPVVRVDVNGVPVTRYLDEDGFMLSVTYPL